MSETADLNVDELRRRARRRLVGAIVLALAAAVIVPMLLESEPRPLGEDVSVKIPPVDDGKFVNRLSEPSNSAPASGASSSDNGKSPAPSEKSSDAAGSSKSAEAGNAAGGPISQSSSPAKDTSAAHAPGSASTASGDAAKGASSGDTKGSAPSASTDDTRTSSTASQDKRAAMSGTGNAESAVGSAASSGAIRTDTPKVTADASKAVAPRGSEAATAPPAATSDAAKDGFSVQLAAFADDKGANALAGKLKKLGYAAYTEPLKTSRGTLWRVRVGPFPSRDAANQVRDHLKTQGQNGIVAPAR